MNHIDIMIVASNFNIYPAHKNVHLIVQYSGTPKTKIQKTHRQIIHTHTETCIIQTHANAPKHLALAPPTTSSMGVPNSEFSSMGVPNSGFPSMGGVPC